MEDKTLSGSIKTRAMAEIIKNTVKIAFMLNFMSKVLYLCFTFYYFYYKRIRKELNPGGKTL
ncbi:MAG TPA: hypothetical protein DHU65_04620 [Clostridiales bacterium]|nr:hypothetical protein [Clostridiales bacterium]